MSFPFGSWLGSVRGPRPIVDFGNFTPTISIYIIIIIIIIIIGEVKRNSN